MSQLGFPCGESNAGEVALKLLARSCARGTSRVFMAGAAEVFTEPGLSTRLVSPSARNRGTAAMSGRAPDPLSRVRCYPTLIVRETTA